MHPILPLTPSLEKYVEHALLSPHHGEIALLLTLGVKEKKIKEVAKKVIKKGVCNREKVSEYLKKAKSWLKGHPEDQRLRVVMRDLFESSIAGEAESFLCIYLAYSDNYRPLNIQIQVNKAYDTASYQVLPCLNNTALALKLMKQKQKILALTENQENARQEIKTLLDDWISEKKSPKLLDQACLNGYFPLVKKLVAAGMDIQAPSLESGFTPLQSAIWGGRENIARWLLKRGADPNGKTVKEVDEKTPLHIACAAENKCTEEIREKIVQMLLDCEARVNETSLNDQTPLHLAAAQGNLAVVRLLIDKGADPTIKDKHGNTPLFYAQNARHSQVVDLLT